MSSNKNVPGLAKSDFLLAQLSVAGAQLFSEPERKTSSSRRWEGGGTARGAALEEKLSLRRDNSQDKRGRNGHRGGVWGRGDGNGGSRGSSTPAAGPEEGWTGPGRAVEGSEAPAPAVHPQKRHSPRLPHTRPSKAAGAGKERAHFQRRRRRAPAPAPQTGPAASPGPGGSSALQDIILAYFSNSATPGKTTLAGRCGYEQAERSARPPSAAETPV